MRNQLQWLGPQLFLQLHLFNDLTFLGDGMDSVWVVSSISICFRIWNVGSFGSGDIRSFGFRGCTCWFRCWSLRVSSSLNGFELVRFPKINDQISCNSQRTSEASMVAWSSTAPDTCSTDLRCPQSLGKLSTSQHLSHFPHLPTLASSSSFRRIASCRQLGRWAMGRAQGEYDRICHVHVLFNDICCFWDSPTRVVESKF